MIHSQVDSAQVSLRPSVTCSSLVRPSVSQSSLGAVAHPHLTLSRSTVLPLTFLHRWLTWETKPRNPTGCSGLVTCSQPCVCSEAASPRPGVFSPRHLCCLALVSCPGSRTFLGCEVICLLSLCILVSLFFIPVQKTLIRHVYFRMGELL